MEKTINNLKIHNFKDSYKKSQELRKPLDKLYNSNGSFIHNTDVFTQKLEIDGFWTLPSGKELSVEEKCHELDWNFSGEMLFEVNHINLDGTHRRNGWALRLMKSDVIIDFCHETGDFYIYKTKSIIKQFRVWYYNESFPTGVTYKPCRNRQYHTNNIKIPRKYLIEHLMLSGNISKRGKVTI